MMKFEIIVKAAITINFPVFTVLGVMCTFGFVSEMTLKKTSAQKKLCIIFSRILSYLLNNFVSLFPVDNTICSC